jgi:hypothetical protein
MKIAKIAFLAGLLAVGLACGYSAKSTPPMAGTMPNIAELAPDNTNSSSSGFVLTVNGTNFNSNATINWNGAAQTTTVVSPGTQLMTTIPATAIATPGMAAVTVTNPGTPGGIYGGGTAAETSNSVTFTIN